MSQSDIHKSVSETYAQIARTQAPCCGPGDACDTSAGSGDNEQAVKSHAQAIGYDAGDLVSVPEGANLGLGCGSPTSLAMIEPGMTVLDLGSGAGIDCFIASPKVGDQGKVIGVDMTDAMLEKASTYAMEHGFANVEFRKGYIEQLPVDSDSVDLIISNCVINLSPDKAKVFGEIHRVLKPGGRVAISDIVLLKPLPQALADDMEAYCGCISGALLIQDYLGHAMVAGLNVQKADRKAYDVMALLRCSPEAAKLLEKVPTDFDGADHVASLDLVLTKPAIEQPPEQPGEIQGKPTGLPQAPLGQTGCDPTGGCC